MQVRPVLHAESQVLAAVEDRDGDLAGAAAQLRVWDGAELRIPRVVVGIEGPPDAGRVEAELAGMSGERLAVAFPEGWLDTEGMREGLEAVRERTGITVIVADFGSGTHPDIEFLVDYPADALALSPRIAEGVGTDSAAAERVRETCDVASRLGWRVIAADVASSEERKALADVGVDEVTGAGIADFADAGGLGGYLTKLGVTLPAGPEPSRRRIAAKQPEAPPQPDVPTPAASAAPVPGASPAATATEARPDGEPEPESEDHVTAWTQQRGASPIKREPTITSQGSGGAALPSGTRGSPGRSQPPRRDPNAPPARGRRLVATFFVTLIFCLLVYAVLAYFGQVPDPLGIEDISLYIQLPR